jgi:hypothetical protein
MDILDSLMQLDWTPGARMSILLAATLALRESAFLFRRAIINRNTGDGDVR